MSPYGVAASPAVLNNILKGWCLGLYQRFVRVGVGVNPIFFLIWKMKVHFLAPML